MTSTTDVTAQKVWFITGCSAGFGKCIAEAALKRGDVVVATARKLAALDDLKAKGAIVHELDVTWSDEKLSGVVDDVIKTAGGIDILVNNAGYALGGGVEEVSREEAFGQFNTNVFGQLNVLRAVLPHMRAKRSGVICNFGSIVGYNGFAGSGLYCASKAACTLHSEALRAEVAHLGIEVTAVEPGLFRTNFLTGQNRKRAERRISDVDVVVDAVDKGMGQLSGNQPGDPVRGAELLVEVLTKTGRCKGRALPSRLALGSDAVVAIPGFMDKVRAEVDEWKELVSQTDFVE